ncbi:hypothetical protein DDQ41_08935 [Streptomyces spongiicola]|uniref:Uncharacterized protein n=1 Tax=Streptomyces spongiicola TaxID=1690221 RepID=A0ABM6V4K3_9ACTN|nr:hypothetical protein DDQ41_08935 [Streptomyces spongiicola]
MSASVLAFAPNAYADWESTIASAGAGFESRRWAEESYTEVQFRGCTIQNSINKSADVQVWRDISLQPDDKYGRKTYTACFKSSTTYSKASWDNLPKGSYYFKIERVGDGGLMWVNKVYVDNTLAD